MIKYIIGISGGVDSCYALHELCYRVDPKEIIAVTFENGWDSDIAKHNIKSIINKTGVFHRYYSCDLHEFREIQRAFLLSGTPHSECPSDVAIKKTMLNAYDEYGAEKIVTGNNVKEGKLPPDTSVVDGLYIKDIMKRLGRVLLRTFPNMNLWDHYRWHKITWRILDDIYFDPITAKGILYAQYGWKDYVTKHYENIYTKFNQGLRYFKFGIDMRKFELGANYNLSEPPYPKKEWLELSKEVGKKLDIDMEKIINLPEINWREYQSYRKYILTIKHIISVKNKNN